MERNRAKRVVAAGLPMLTLVLGGCLTASEPLGLGTSGLGGAGTGLDLPVEAVLFPDYHLAADINDELWALAAAHPELVHVREAGRSLQGRPILVAEVTNHALRASEPDRPVAFIDGCHHGNEIQGCEAPLYTARFLADNYATNATVRWLLDRFEVHVMPAVNPDGRDLMTRVNRDGINLNRNYPTDHGNPLGLSYPLGAPVTPITWRLPSVGSPVQPPAVPGVPGVPTRVSPSENGGWAPLDQPETRAVHNWMVRVEDRLALYLTFHTATHSIVVPWAAYDAPRPMPTEHDAVFDAALAWFNAHTTYKGGRLGWGDNSGNLSYAASGSSMDWGYDRFEVPSFTVETHVPAAVRDDWPSDVNFWGNSSLNIVLYTLMNLDRFAAWEAPDRAFPVPEEWIGVHLYPGGATAETRSRAHAPGEETRDAEL